MSEPQTVVLKVTLDGLRQPNPQVIAEWVAAGLAFAFPEADYPDVSCRVDLVEEGDE